MTLSSFPISRTLSGPDLFLVSGRGTPQPVHDREPQPPIGKRLRVDPRQPKRVESVEGLEEGGRSLP